MSDPQNPTPTSIQSAVSQLLMEQCQRWHRGERVLAETFLVKHPELTDNVEAALDVIYNEFLLREERGEQPTVTEYVQRFPHLAGPLKVQFAADEVMNIDPSDQPTQTGSGTRPRVGPLPRIPGYQVLEEIGRGGMGVVYRARHLELDRIVALKRMRSDARQGSDELARFRREAEIVARLHHPNIVQIHDVGEHDGQPFLALEYVEGLSLAKKLHGKPQPARQSAEVVAVLARAIHHAHQRDVIHRDLKPANVLLQQAGRTDDGSSIADCPAKITDFGLARRIQLANLTRTDAILGTPSYMAPEQAQTKAGDVTPATDVYALGAILYEMLTGRPPFHAETALNTLAQVLADDPVPPRQLQPTVPIDLETICLKCLQKEAHHRYPTAQELADDLERFLESRPIRARPLGPLGRMVKWAHRQPVVASLLGLLLVVVGVGFSLVTWKWLEARYEWQRAESQQHQTEQALGAAQQARREAEEKQREAEHAESRATASATAENKARRKADRMAGVLALDRGQALGEQGEVGRGLLWLVRSLEIATEAHDANLERAVRASLGDWSRRVHPLKMVLPYAQGLGGMAISADGKTLLNGNSATAALLWDLTTGQRVPDVIFTDAQVTGQVHGVAFSPDGKTVLTGATDRKARLWDAGTCKSLIEPLDHPAAVRSVAFSPDGKTLLTGCGDVGRGEARLWDATTGKHLGTLVGHSMEVRSAAFSPDGKTVLTGSQDRTARLWDAVTHQQRGEAMQHGDSVLVAAFAPDGRTVLTGSQDRTARLWDTATGKLAAPPLHHPDAVFAATYTPDSRTLITGSRGIAYFWEASTGKLLEKLPADPGAVYDLACTREGKTVLTGGAWGVRVWETPSERLAGLPLWQQGDVRAVAFSPDGKKILSGSGPFAQVWDVTSGKPIGNGLFQNQLILAVACGRDGKTLLTGGADHTARLWDAATGKQTVPSLEHQAGVSVVALSPDCRTALTGSQDGTACVWDVATGKRRFDPLRLMGSVNVAMFSPDGKTFLTTSEGANFASLWDTETGKAVGKPLTHQFRIVSAAFSPDGKTIVTGGSDSFARTWETATGTPLSEPLMHGGYVTWVAFTPDGKTLLTGGDDRGIRMREVPNGTVLATPSLHEGDIQSLAVSPDGSMVLTGSMDHTARFWDTATRTLIGAPLQHPDRAATVAYSPDGRTVLTIDGHSTARLWRAPAPLSGEVARIKLWAEVVTGMSLMAKDEEGGLIRVLRGQDWETRRKRLDALGGLAVARIE